MPSYKLIYFDHRAKTEPIRLAFHFAGVKFDDHRLKDGEWPKIKETTPQGKCPVLEVDGKKMIPQSGAILRYVGREFGLCGQNNAENTDVDVVVATVDELFDTLGKVFEEKDEEKKKEMIADLRKTHLDRFCKIFCAMLDESGKGWFVGSKISIADLAVYNAFELFQVTVGGEKDAEKDLLKDKEKLLTHRRKVRETQGIKEYLNSRPETQF